MKKAIPILILLILLVAAGIFFVFRDTNDEETPLAYNESMAHDPMEYPEHINEYVYPEEDMSPIDAEETQQERSERIGRERREFAESITREQILDDFDYMMAVLEANFPFFDLTYRRHGVDIREEARRFRDVLADEDTPIDAMVFEERLSWDFFNSIHWVGHLRTLTRLDYVIYMNIIANNPESYAAFCHGLTSRPSISQFYGDFNVYDYAKIMEQFETFEQEYNYFDTGVIAEGNIAYIRINTLLGDLDLSKTVLSEFYNQISDFEHLIIDIRGNTGRLPHVFHELITIPHLRRPIQFEFITFYKDGSYNLMFLDALFATRYIDATNKPSHLYDESFIVTDEEIIGRDGRPLPLNTQYLPWGDLDAFKYYNIGFYYTLYPPGSNDFQSSFNGQMWLLTDRYSGSGSEHVVALYKQENLAIIVGEQGWGMFMCPILLSNYFALPNTGIIVRYDVGYPVCLHTGRPLEEGIPPHFHNRPGMDALQTVLELIAEGAYKD